MGLQGLKSLGSRRNADKSAYVSDKCAHGLLNLSNQLDERNHSTKRDQMERQAAYSPEEGNKIPGSEGKSYQDKR